MLKSILKLEGAQKLTKGEQKEINGGKETVQKPCCDPYDTTGVPCIVCL
jgi:hypothetical protein